MLSVEAVRYRRAPDWPDAGDIDGPVAAERFGALLGEEIALASEGLGDDDVALSLCVSTIIDLPFTSGWLKWADVAAAARRRTPHAPRNFSASYECAGWGFALDYAGRRAAPGSRVVVTVADINLLDISYWRANPNWGRSSFGVATLVVRLPQGTQQGAVVNSARSAHGMGEYCADLRDWLKRSPSRAANAPFLPADMARIYGHFLPAGRMLPNLHARWGHAFGSDTWLSYLELERAGELQGGAVYTASAASLRGYWTIADMTFAPHCRFALADRGDGAGAPI